MSIEKKPAKWVENILRFPIRTFIEWRSDIRIEQNDTIGLKPPYIILANHVNNWDPSVVNSYVPEMMCFVAGDSLFRIPVLKNILHYTGAIPKAKFRNDTSTIRNMIRAKKHHRIIGIFPEGNRNWDGRTEPIIFSTAKLVKAMNIPVVIATIKGGHLSHPRWANGHRKGRIAISYRKIWDKGDVKNLSPEDIHQKLTEELAHDEMDWQAKQNVPYNGKNLAHYLERLLFLCPHCHTSGNLHSDGDHFQCRSCHYEVKYTATGFFEQVNHPLIFQTTTDWNQWQMEYWKKELINPSEETPFSMTDEVKLYVSSEKESFKLISSGTLSWENTSEHAIFQEEQNRIHQFSINKLEGLNIHLHHYLDFLYDGRNYRIEFFNPRTSAYKWLRTFQILSGLKSSKEVMS
jgi:1-acyl-sn-glycerol-3-phosphate acyltransferase